jgi:hypothetical protein|tara:strand:+ start:244 stop:486 length:243 start_codon:yes stop_codon:yes gene_type:complete
MRIILNKENKMNNDTKLIIAKALRSKFNEIQHDLLTLTYMGDEYILDKVREMQDTYRVFSKVSDELKAESREHYEKLLGV